MRTEELLLLLIIPLVLLSGCSISDSPLTPLDNPSQDISATATTSDWSDNRVVWGLWNIKISADRNTVEIIPDRTGAMHLNCVRLLEVEPCSDCLTISNIVLLPSNELSAHIQLRHPYPGNPNLTGFDVRGILISVADYTFENNERCIAWGEGMLRLLNPDGYTALFNPTDFPETNPPALGYIPGVYAMGGNLTATLNPYIAYNKYAPRRMFESGGVKTRVIRLRAPDGPLEFGYAVDTCWQLVDGEVTNPVEDFPPDANCLEAYEIEVEIGSGLKSGELSSVPINVEVFDHQGLDTISMVAIEAPDLFNGEVELVFSDVTGEESFIFTGTVTNELETVSGEYPLLVRITDTEVDQNLGIVDAWDVCGVKVGPNNGWVRTWGGEGIDNGYAVALDNSDNVFVAGMFNDSVDFDPGPESDWHHTNGPSYVYHAFLSKFDTTGSFQWARTWGSGLFAQGSGIAIDNYDNIYVAGDFFGVVDFDPGPGEDKQGSIGTFNAYLSKFNSNGDYLWARIWGQSHINSSGVAVDGFSNVYVIGHFNYDVDFDPGAEVEEYTSNGDWDVYLSKFNSDGEFQWTRTWGGDGHDDPRGIASDGLSNIYVAGNFRNSVDFDPGLGSDIHISKGDRDAFLSCFNTAGEFQWARTWGGGDYNRCEGVTTGESGDIYVTGTFVGASDFDPGPADDPHDSVGDGGDIFLSKFDSTGSFQWARTWGGIEHDGANGIGVDYADNAYVTGFFRDIVDFDPGPGSELHFSDNGLNSFLSKINSAGEFIWARTWGGAGYQVATDWFGSTFVTGTFSKVADFDPGPGVENHTSNGSKDVYLSRFPADGKW